MIGHGQRQLTCDATLMTSILLSLSYLARRFGVLFTKPSNSCNLFYMFVNII